MPGDKRPAVRAWENRATTDHGRIAHCRFAGDFNIGIATGPSRLVVLDLGTSKDDVRRDADRWRSSPTGYTRQVSRRR
ncbi:bifunctional DNA primase/polymerase [Streptomyces sp. NPDC001070]